LCKSKNLSLAKHRRLAHIMDATLTFIMSTLDKLEAGATKKKQSRLHKHFSLMKPVMFSGETSLDNTKTYNES